MNRPAYASRETFEPGDNVEVPNAVLESRKSYDSKTQAHQSNEQKTAFIPPSNNKSSQRENVPWPWRAILAQLIALACLAACWIVLAVSNRKSQSSWHVQGATVSWWLKLSSGSTFRELHREWKVGQNSLDAASLLLHKSSSAMLATGTLSLGLYIIVNPLLQRAANVEQDTSIKSVVVNTSLPISVPLDWTTVAEEVLPIHAGAISSQLLDVLKGYNAGTPAAANVTGCDGTCTGSVSAFGLNGTCQETSSSAHDWAQAFFANNTRNSATLFNVTFPDINLQNGDWDAIPQFQFLLTFWTASNATNNSAPISSLPQGKYQYCPGIVTTKNCTYDVDLVDYPVSMTSSSIVLNSNNSYFGPPQHKSKHLDKLFTYAERLAGFQLAARNLFSSLAVISNPKIIYIGANREFNYASWDLGTQGSLASEQVQFNFSDSGSCFQTYTDPTGQITRGLSDILLRSAIAAARAQNDIRGYTSVYQQNITAQQRKEDLVFVSHYLYFAIAAAITLIEMILVSLPFWGFWRLNRAVTLSPLETAFALKEQIGFKEDISMGSKELLEVIGDESVRYRLVLKDIKYERACNCT
ncbi:hypothetical protein BT63DRAFT_453146 [Microthyrium microscopicum]|uniref:Uncharacterized protein n=1 Tax=Microthyrium microscopicum TaxID=703497 RepID=A0A6A6UGU4_9PEZI|nr:hypothetical protein BT63DRAFT_453146 [Microthyrium microscopicum]